MDEEGFPLHSEMEEPVRLPCPINPCIRRRQVSADQESGETTSRQVMMVRRPRVVRWTSSTNANRSQEHSEMSFRKVMQLHLSLVALSHTMPSFKFHHPTCPKGKCAAASSSVLRKGDERDFFRVPRGTSDDSQSEIQQPKREIIVSVWKECLYGDRLFDVSAAELANAPRDGCFLSILTRHLEKFVPNICIKLVALLLVALRCVMCQVNVTFVYMYRVRQHEKIHMKCEERGLKPVFTGSACHGPIIWSVRYLSCQYCRAQKESDISLKLLEILNKERRDGLKLTL